MAGLADLFGHMNDTERLHLNIYRDWGGLNSHNSWWDHHDTAEMVDIESLFPDLRFLDYEINPVINNSFTNDAGIDGSSWQYNSAGQSTLTLHFWLHFDSYYDFLDKKRDIQNYFTSKAAFELSFSNHPIIHARCYTSKCDMTLKDQGTHDLLFDVEMINALGLWFTNKTSLLQKRWKSSWLYDLHMAVGVSHPDWSLKPGSNNIYIPEGVRIQMTNPNMELGIKIYGASGSVSINNETTGTELSAKGDGVTGNLTWYNLNLKNSAGEPINQYSNSRDFWLDPGVNKITLTGAAGGYVDTRFFFAAP